LNAEEINSEGEGERDEGLVPKGTDKKAPGIENFQVSIRGNREKERQTRAGENLTGKPRHWVAGGQSDCGVTT